ncbi:hypothetical protein, partial [Neglectibacter timonensis]|uniref:hypothetical protein n=2 Tax=Neglectibacter timonensis TaxID=1776382 RepID=UPI0023F52228
VQFGIADEYIAVLDVSQSGLFGIQQDILQQNALFTQLRYLATTASAVATAIATTIVAAAIAAATETTAATAAEENQNDDDPRTTSVTTHEERLLSFTLYLMAEHQKGSRI